MSCNGDCRCCKNLRRALDAQTTAEDERDKAQARCKQLERLNMKLEGVVSGFENSELRLSAIEGRLDELEEGAPSCSYCGDDGRGCQYCGD